MFFPTKCVGCFCEGEILCRNCFLRIKKIHERVEVDELDEVFALYRYEKGGILQVAMKALKYRLLRDVAGVFREDLERFLEEKFTRTDSLLVPVPLHHTKQKWRGFNQAEELIRGIDWPRFNGLKRIRSTESQAEKSRAGRLENLRGAFDAELTGFLNKKFILIDDVCSTGSTLSECARTLRSAGAREIYGIVLGHGHFK